VKTKALLFDDRVKREFLLRRRPTLAGEIAGVLRELIDKGKVAGFLPPERALCARFGVSRPTIRGGLAILKREGVLRVRHGQRTEIVLSRQRQPARTGQPVVNLLAPSYPVVMNTENALIAEELESHLHAADFDFRVICDPRFRAGNWGPLAARIVAQNPADCWILRSVSLPIQHWFAESGLPTVLVAPPFPGIALPSVDLDHRATCRHAVGQFALLSHRRIVFLSGNRGLTAEMEGEKGFAEGRELAGLPDHECEIVRFESGGEDLVQTLERLFRRTDRPTALLVDETMETVTTVTWLLRNGLRVPEDVSVIARGWDTVFDYAVPRIACYRFDRRVLVGRICRWVFRLVRHEDIPRRFSGVVTKFHRGGTLAAPKPAA
jgi:hypothetical protein